jgi:hypothetical protein
MISFVFFVSDNKGIFEKQRLKFIQTKQMNLQGQSYQSSRL